MKITDGKIETLEFYKQHIFKKTNLDLMPRKVDRDEYKLPALELLFEQIVKFRDEMKSVGIGLGKSHQSDDLGIGYLLTDKEYSEPYPTSIQFLTKLLDRSFTQSFHPAHTIVFKISQPLHYTGEMRDEILVGIRYSPIAPFHWSSCWKYTLSSKGGESFFKDIDLEPGESQSFEFDDLYNLETNFQTKCFNKSVAMICLLSDKLISRKSYLVDTVPQNYKIKR